MHACLLIFACVLIFVRGVYTHGLPHQSPHEWPLITVQQHVCYSSAMLAIKKLSNMNNEGASMANMALPSVPFRNGMEGKVKWLK